MMVGEINVDAMLRRITAKQLVGWEAYIALEPFQFDRELRADYRAASIREMVHNVAVTKGQKPLKNFLIDFEPKEPETKVTDVVADQKMLEMALMLSFGMPLDAK